MRNPFAKAEFRWNDWNVGHIAKHGVEPYEAETVVRHPVAHWPRRIGDRWIAQGRTPAGRRIQVVFVEDEADIRSVYVIHARPL